MSKHAYAYFNSDGTLREFIIDPSVRQGNEGFNEIYVYWENQPIFDMFGLTWINTDNTDAEWSTPEAIVKSSITFTVTPIQDYDPRYFEYGKPYNGYKITLPDEMFAESGNIALSLFAFSDDNDNDEYDESDQIVRYLGLITFHVETTGASFPVMIDRSQFYILLNKFDDYCSREEVEAMLDSYYTKNETTELFYTKSQIDSGYYTKLGTETYVNTQISAASIPGATFDNYPIEHSDNVVKSGGIYDAINSIKRYRHDVQIYFSTDSGTHEGRVYFNWIDGFEHFYSIDDTDYIFSIIGELKEKGFDINHPLSATGYFDNNNICAIYVDDYDILWLVHSEGFISLENYDSDSEATGLDAVC